MLPAVDADPSHGNVVRIRGQVPAELPWPSGAAQEPMTIDRYWQAIYPDSLIPAYPAAGTGFSFLYGNAPFDATGGGRWVGIAFDLKVNVASEAVWVSMPMVGTDLPDPTEGDVFPKTCQYYTADNTPSSGGSNCFSYHRMGLFSISSVYATASPYNLLADVGLWKRYCVLYSQVTTPNWANAETIAMMPRFDPTQLLKLTWDMFQPHSDLPRSAFDVSLDNIRLITAAEARDASNQCDPSMIGAPYGSGNAG
jgi:hypothetical protein